MSDELDAKRRLSTLDRPISPPPTRPLTRNGPTGNDSLAALEAGKEETQNAVERISARLRRYVVDRNNIPKQVSLITIDAWKALYNRNCHPTGRHFVIHQHDHPIAGPHYDLRLQFSESSSLSWSVMYGLPGDPNSRRLNRNATETRVHALWNHLIETASARTGSMIIWDTGEYEVLPDKPKGSNIGPETDESEPETHSASGVGGSGLPESEKLRNAFQNSKIHLRLHGTRLPHDYTIFLRRDKTDFRSAPTVASLLQKPRKRRRRRTAKAQPDSTSDSESDTDITLLSDTKSPGTGKRQRDVNIGNEPEPEHSDAEGGDKDVDFQIRLNNAYPGAVNDIGSIHQRRWFIMLDRAGCGFVPEKLAGANGEYTGEKRWIRGVDKRFGTRTGFEPFHVHGPEVERSVVTGRRGPDVLRDEGAEGFVSRRGWKPVIF
ncbi:uncharacterized protein DSM5745_01138 [Aspergillus mulundensis]|uniref:DNA ligase D 3'-phosphoesterase domain-containing protein n=1 Tax=Aspergillus mulundensis TaxID=1810919 RepID=A0A3D8T5H2_9EURO|nr:Uncharacterized protein DSM5745_01138 [Aspergillus mulundensis]RDW93816.1 Uncharacterized protein DSM5745_01138 [Aspergillus mulundensis]